MLCATLVLGACESSLNPVNWFGNSKSQTVVTDPAQPASTDPRPTVNQVTDMAVERVPGGAIVRATGLPGRQGFWDAALVREGEKSESGVLTFQFRIFPPLRATEQGTPPSREITAAVFLSGQALEGVRTIVVRGATNQRSARR